MDKKAHFTLFIWQQFARIVALVYPLPSILYLHRPPCLSALHCTAVFALHIFAFWLKIDCVFLEIFLWSRVFSAARQQLQERVAVEEGALRHSPSTPFLSTAFTHYYYRMWKESLGGFNHVTDGHRLSRPRPTVQSSSFGSDPSDPSPSLAGLY